MKVGILGAGTIVPDFLRGQSYIEDIEVKAICGVDSDIENMEKLSAQYSIKNIYTDYDQMLRNDNIDTIYIAVPNHLHFTMAKKALLAGKNAIVEKPFTANLKEAKELVSIAKEKKLFLFDAAANIHCPNYLKMKELVREIGDTKIIQINYSQYSRRYDQFKAGVTLPVFDPKKAGGALMDLNVYGVNTIVGLYGKPDNVYYFANIEKGIDTSGILILDYGKFKAESISAKDCKAPCSINIQGDKACLHSNESPNCFGQFELFKNSGEKDIFELNDHSMYERMYYELNEFAKILREKDYERAEQLLHHTLNVIEVLDKARTFAGISFE